ncbi:MAG: pilus assembly protein PilM [Candidatus Omnitrophota bacterium]
MNSLGMYFGPKVIDIVESTGRKLLNQAQVPQSTIAAGELEEKVPPEVKIVEITALFKDEFRRNKIEAKEATICLSGNDLIIRTFEIPLLPRNEIASAVNFEAKKYIPFKVEDLITDFQVKYNKSSRTNLVLFMGIKKEVLERYITVFSQLNIRIDAIEYSAFSAWRSIRMAGASDSGVAAFLGVDLSGQDEANFTVFEDGFPLFSRDIALAGGPQDLEIAEAQEANYLEKIKTELRVSLDYYRRKFPEKNVKKVYFVSGPEAQQEIEAFIRESGYNVQYFDTLKITGRPLGYSLGFIKSFGASLSKAGKNPLKLNLLAAKEKVKETKEKEAELEEVSLFEGLSINFKVVLVGILVCFAAFGYGLSRLEPLRKDLNAIIASRAQVADINPEATLEELVNISNEYKSKIETVEKLISKQVFITEALNIIPRAIPEGVWLLDFSISKEDTRAEINFRGMAFLNDSEKEFQAVSGFASNLKGNPRFSKFFKKISVTSIDRGQLEKATVTNFAVSCRTQGE